MKSIALLISHTSFSPKKKKKNPSVLKDSRRRDKSLNQSEYKRTNYNMLLAFLNFSLRLFSIAHCLNLCLKYF